MSKKSAIDVAQDLLAGRLTRLMPEYKIPLTEIWLVLPSRQLISPAVRIIRDELKLSISDLRTQLINSKIIAIDEWPDAEDD